MNEREKIARKKVPNKVIFLVDVSKAPNFLIQEGKGRYRGEKEEGVME